MTSNLALSFYKRHLKPSKTSTENMDLSASNRPLSLTMSCDRSNSKTTVMAVDMKAKLMSRADQMAEESSLFLLSTTMRGTSQKVSSMEEADRYYNPVK